METALRQAAFPRTDGHTLAGDGDALNFCSTCAFSQPGSKLKAGGDYTF